jgi:hypothetical protein
MDRTHYGSSVNSLVSDHQSEPGEQNQHPYSNVPEFGTFDEGINLAADIVYDASTRDVEPSIDPLLFSPLTPASTIKNTTFGIDTLACSWLFQEQCEFPLLTNSEFVQIN